MYIPNIKLEPFSSGDIRLLVLKEAVEQPYCLAKNTIFILKNTHTSSVYFAIKFSGITTVYPNVILRS